MGKANTQPLAWFKRGLAMPSGKTFGVLLVALLCGLPVFVVLSFAGTPIGPYWTHLSETVLPGYIINTIWLVLAVAIGVTIGGVGSAWLVSMCRFPGRRILEWALLLPFAIPAYVLAYTYTGLLDYAGPVQEALRTSFGWERGDYWFPQIRSLGGAITMMILVLYPYVYMLSRAAFIEQSVCSLEASRTLGCTPWQSMRRVALPLARPSIVTGVALALMETLNDFGTVQFFGVDTFTTGIYRTWLGQGNPAAAAKLAAMLLFFVFAVLLLERWSRGRAAFHQISAQYRPLPAYELKGFRATGAFLFCFIPVWLGFLVPAFALTSWSLESVGEVVDGSFLTLSLNSIILAAIAAAMTIIIGLLLVYSIRNGGNRIRRGLVRFASLGYAIPGAVIAVGVVIPFAWFDKTVGGWLKSTLGLEVGLLLSGTIFALLFAYVVRFLAVSFGSLESGFSRVTPHMDDAARLMGHKAFAIVTKVHAPVIRGSILAAALLVFVDVLKELPATLMIRPFNFDTLAIRTYEFATDEQLVEAAPSALAIVLAGVLPVILLSRALSGARAGQAQEKKRKNKFHVPAETTLISSQAGIKP